jgi:hypothetical protein
MDGKQMARTFAELDREISTLQAEVDLLKRQADSWASLVHQWAGCFTSEPDWAAIHHNIEAERREPDPELTGP